MIHQDNPSEKVSTEISRLFQVLKIKQFLHVSNIRKACGVSVIQVFEFIFLLTFQGQKMNSFLASKRGQDLPSKDTYYRFLENPTYAWRKFLSLLAFKVVAKFSQLTSEKRVRVFIIDDTLLTRNRTKKAELLARVYDHVNHCFVKGYTLLTLGWSDGYSFVPLDFSLLSSTKAQNRIQEACVTIDNRTNGGKRRREALVDKPTNALQLIENALNAGINADYVLMDSWFTTEPMLRGILEKRLQVIGMVKQLKQRYTFQDKALTLKDLRATLPQKSRSEIIGSRIVSTKHGISVKIVFVQNRNRKREWLCLLSTDISLEDQEIIRIYGNRWSIEVFFKSTKSLLKLGSEFQGRNFDLLIGHTTVVFSRYLLLEWERRQTHDYRTFGGLFQQMCAEIQDLDYETAIKQLIFFINDLLENTPRRSAKFIQCQVLYWVAAQPNYIKALMPNFCCDT